MSNQDQGGPSFQSADQQIKERLVSQNELQYENQDSNMTANSLTRKKKNQKSTFHSVIEKMDFDQALEKVGSQDWYQKRAFIIFACQWFSAAMILLSGDFIFPADPKFICDKSMNLNKDQCEKYVCSLDSKYWQDHLEYPTGKDHTTASQKFNLICGRSALNSVIQSSPFVGSLCGFILFPMIADNKGRLWGWGLSWASAALGAVLMATSWNYPQVLIGYFLSGFGCNPAITLHYSFLNEHSTGKLREFTSIGVQVAYGFGEIFMVLIAWLIHDWRLLTIVMLCVPTLALMIGPLFVYESPRFQYEKDRALAINTLNKIAKINGKEEIHLKNLESFVAPEEKTYSVIDLFKYPSLRLVSYCACFVFFAIQAIYYGISFSMGSVGLNLYVNTVIIASAETLAYCVTDLCIPKLRRKITVIIGLGIGCLLSLSYFWINPQKKDADGNIEPLSHTLEIVQIIVAALYRFNIAFVWTVVYVYFSEIYPTVVRSLALGSTSLAGTIGSAGAPFLISGCQSIGFQPMVALGIIGLLAIFHVFALPETLGKPLKQQIDELVEKKEDMEIEWQEPDDNEQAKLFVDENGSPFGKSDQYAEANGHKV